MDRDGGNCFRKRRHPGPRPAEPLPPSEWQHLTERLRNNLGQVEALRASQVFVAVPRADGTVQVLGLTANESHRTQIEGDGLRALQHEYDNGLIKVAVKHVDASKMAERPQDRPTPLQNVLAMDKALAAIPDCFLRVQSYDPVKDALYICGSVPTAEHHHVLKECLGRFHLQLLFDDVVVVDHKIPRDDYVWSFADVTRALANQSGEQLLAGSQQLIRRGYNTSEAWYFRAAGHLLAGRETQAVGAVRIAASMEAEETYSYYRSRRFAALERFQGNLRERLERMVDAGPVACIVQPN